MQCIRPIKAGYNSAGDLVYRNTGWSNELVGLQFECRKCLPCRLNIAREKAIRCWHESKCHDDSIFLTLTYDDAHLASPRLQYIDFQLFMKSLREFRVRKITDPDLRKKFYIPMMVTGEYGELNKRPHWHALLFNYRPIDAVYKYTTDRGDKVWSSEEISSLWSKGSVEFGSVTIDSAGYVARYAAKKLVHGKDGEHDFNPIHKTSSRHAIGRSWIERHWRHCFHNGFVVLPDGSQSKIPRYYVDWLAKEKPDEWLRYVTGIRQTIIDESVAKSRREELEYLSSVLGAPERSFPLDRKQVKVRVLQTKFKRLQERLKL